MKKNAQQKLKHKPNARHTLSEVLHSLQDMMHNELAGIADADGSESSKKSGASLSKEEVLSSLKALIGTPENTSQLADPASSDKAVNNAPVDDAPEPDTIAKETAADSELNDPVLDEEILLEEFAESLPEEKLPQDSSTQDDPNGETIKAGKAETKAADSSSATELPKDRNETLPPADDFRLEMEDPRKVEPETEPETTPKAHAKVKKKSRKNKGKPSATNASEQVELNWDDIPVLNEVVAPPPVPDDATTQEARAIATKVAAALNIEARNKGGDTMDIKAIMRLQSLLSQELQERKDDSDETDNDEPDDDNNT